MKMETPKEIADYFERLCSKCLLVAINEYLSRASHQELRALKARIYLLLEAPCKTEECQEDCNED
jgi:hypothetical protein